METTSSQLKGKPHEPVTKEKNPNHAWSVSQDFEALKRNFVVVEVTSSLCSSRLYQVSEGCD